MKAQLNLLAASLILAASSITQASFTLYQPLEESRGGALPNGSIGFKDHSGSGDNGSGNEGGQEEPVVKTPAELCNEKAEAAKNLFASSYNDVFYVSHKIGESKNWFTGVTTEGCILTFSSPKNKTATCTGKTAYVDSISPKLLDGGLGIMKVVFEYYGSCS